MSTQDLKQKPGRGQDLTEKTRYSDEELLEFKELILQKIEAATFELETLKTQFRNLDSHGTDDTARSFHALEDGSESLAKEEAGQMFLRQQRYIDQLKNALIRIETKTYGICFTTGKLIPKERLRLVPHTTRTIEGKQGSAL